MIEIDGAHGRTAGADGNGTRRPQITDHLAVAAALLRHSDEESCACTCDLRWKSGVAP